jgi:hypothetical protein
LRDEIVKEHYDPARVSANINPVFSRVSIAWSGRMGVFGRRVGPTEKTN